MVLNLLPRPKTYRGEETRLAAQETSLGWTYGELSHVKVIDSSLNTNILHLTKLFWPEINCQTFSCQLIRTLIKVKVRQFLFR
jgi:hypothetical protein